MIEQEKTREEIAALALISLAQYPALLRILEFEQVNRESLEETASLLLYTALYLEEVDEEITVEDDPRILLPLLRALADTFSLLALFDRGSVEKKLLLNKNDIDQLLSEEVEDFLVRFGQEKAWQVMHEARR